MVKEFWTSFQLFLGEQKIPIFLVELLKTTGYDSALSIQSLNEKSISELEKYIASQPHSFDLKNTAYESIEIFKFLPGHIALFKSLSLQVDKFLSSLNSHNKTKNQSEILAPIPEEIELLSQSEEKALKEKLISKVTQYCIKNSVSIENLYIANISNTLNPIIQNFGKIVYKTQFTCHLCKVETPCIYNKYWQISNLEKHIKKHKSQPVLVSEANGQTNGETSGERAQIDQQEKSKESGQKISEKQSTESFAEELNSVSISSSVLRLNITAEEELNKILASTSTNSENSTQQIENLIVLD